MARNPKSCPYCHHTIAQPRLAPSLDDEVAFLRAEANRLEDVISKLESERMSLLQRLNEICSPIYVLPSETLAEIFDYACSTLSSSSLQDGEADDRTEDYMGTTHLDDDIGDSLSEELQSSRRKQSCLMGLGGVSVYWREVLFEHPRLWTSVCLRVDRYTGEAKAALLRLFLNNSGDLPLTLSLLFDTRNPLFFFDRYIDDLLVENLPRIRQLTLIHPSVEWMEYISLLSSLSDLTYVGHISMPQTLQLASSSHLQHASFRYTDTTIELPWSNITTLELDYVPIDTCIHLLFQCINLVEYCAKASTSPLTSFEGFVFPDGRRIFGNLAVFSWEQDSTEVELWASGMFPRLRFPALRALRLIYTSEHRWESDQWTRNFFKHLPYTLSSIEIGLPSSPFAFIFEELDPNLHVERFVVSKLEESFLLPLFEWLTPSINNGHPHVPFPKLWNLVLEGPLPLLQVNPPNGIVLRSGTFSSNHLQALLQVLKARLNTPQDTFRLDLRRMMGIDWLPVRLELREMVRCGLRLEIFEEDDLVPWLYD